VAAIGKKELSKFLDADVGRINWIHGYAEDTGLAGGKYDLIAASFIFHELPTVPTTEIVQEMFRITAKGGVIAITDNNPRSPIIKGLPPALFTLMKSTVGDVDNICIVHNCRQY
jgi:ubiquinone/menaquinone biosynthesis C-methylase UbiE